MTTITSKKPRSYDPSNYDLFVALDVDKNSFSLTAKNVYNMEKTKRIPANPEAFYRYIRNSYPSERIIFAYEAGPTGYSLSDYLTLQKERCLVISPNSIMRGANEKVKNNRIDSRRLSALVKGGLVDSIYIPDLTRRQLRRLTTTRQDYAKKQRIAKQQIEALLLFENLRPFVEEQKRWSNNHINILKNMQCNYGVKTRLNSLLEDLSYARNQILNIHKQIKEFCLKDQSIQKNMGYLRSIPGIGFVTAAYALSRIADPAFLDNALQIGGFAGVVPTENSTGGKINKGRITHLGDRELRRLLIEASWVAIRKDAELRFFYERIKNRHPHKGGSQIAIVAVARKLTQRIYKVLKEQRNYVIH